VTLTRQDLEREAAATGFAADTLEKVIRLLSLLDALRSHPFLKGRIALKGGTALNLFVFDVPRLSVVWVPEILAGEFRKFWPGCRSDLTPRFGLGQGRGAWSGWKARRE
jgi:hypothetical protein